MRGRALFLAFFVLFGVASYAVPVPLFPGSIVPSWFGSVPAEYIPLLGAIVNGIVYGSIIWFVFVLAARRFEEPKVTKRQSNTKRRT